MSSPAATGWDLFRQAAAALAQSGALEPLAGGTTVVLGAGGMLGAAVLEVLSLLANGDSTGRTKIIAVSRTGVEARPGIQCAQGSVTSDALYASLPVPDYVLFIAGTSSDYLRRPEETIDTTVGGVAKCLDYAAQAKGVVIVSSTRVFGPFGSNQEVLTEDSRAIVEPMSPLNIYDSSKRLAESMALVAYQQRGMNAKVVRLTNIYGPYASRPRDGFIGEMLASMLGTRSLSLRGHPDSIRNYCFSMDAAQGLLRALVAGEPGEAYHVGSHEHVGNLELARTIAGTLPFAVDIDVPASALAAAKSTASISIDKAERQLGYKPAASMAAALPMVVEWTQQALTLAEQERT